MPPEKIRKFEELDTKDPRYAAPNRFYPAIYGEYEVSYGSSFTGTLRDAVQAERQMRVVMLENPNDPVALAALDKAINDPANNKQRAQMYQDMIDKSSTGPLNPSHRIDFS